MDATMNEMGYSIMGKFWQLLILLIIGAIVLESALDFIIPLVPYMLGVAVLAIIGKVVYERHRSW